MIAFGGRSALIPRGTRTARASRSRMAAGLVRSRASAAARALSAAAALGAAADDDDDGIHELSPSHESDDEIMPSPSPLAAALSSAGGGA